LFGDFAFSTGGIVAYLEYLDECLDCSSSYVEKLIFIGFF